MLNTFTVFFSVTEISVRNWWAQFTAFSREAPVPMVSLVRGPRGLVAMAQTSREKARIAGLLKGWWWFYSLKSSREGGLLNFHEVVIDEYSRKMRHMQRCECPNFCRYFLVPIFTLQFLRHPQKLAHDDSYTSITSPSAFFVVIIDRKQPYFSKIEWLRTWKWSCPKP